MFYYWLNNDQRVASGKSYHHSSGEQQPVILFHLIAATFANLAVASSWKRVRQLLIRTLFKNDQCNNNMVKRNTATGIFRTAETIYFHIVAVPLR